ncbi:RHS repeat-associated core domain-containing protein [Pedobacter steynii]|uniref:RHS repeat-associated core domain-containing protein n=1 Tax=Pedobacter steynii TaxID=430522 RepID=A0A1H0ARY8_9SPHI|nr:DUF6443 domain-containing protein [Pedobacter steynii]NQX41281.1 hypothetical protein [Pedobacter steynii]SDN36141.1 RHS repeat-associated core domain-containing protein [Pedobacter steynii]
MKTKLFILLSLLLFGREVNAQIEYVVSKEVSQYEGKSYLASNSVTLKSGFHFISSAQSVFFAAIGNPPSTPGPTREITMPAFIETQIVRVRGVKSDADLWTLTPEQKLVSRKYLDGLGRDLQEIFVGAGSAAKPDIVTFNEYDMAGRRSTNYLPYAANSQGQFQNTAVNDQLAFYSTSNTSGKYAKDNAPYSQTIYDNSPTQTILQQGAVGANWQISTGKVKQVATRVNTDAEQVRLFAEDGSSTGFYAAGALNVSEITDEEGQKMYLFADKEGKNILKRQLFEKTINGVYHQYKETYYLYSASGFQTSILPPNVVATLKSNGWNLTVADRESNIFRFIYDDEGRLIKQKRPSSTWVYIIYDQLDRPVLIQNGLLRAANKWCFTKYDALNRPVMEGIMQDNQRLSYEDMKGFVDTFNYSDPSVPFCEERGSGIEGYTNLSFPTSINSNALLSVTYYDNYDIDNNGTDNYSYTAQGLGTEEGVQGSVQGKISVIKNRIVGTTNWMEKVLFYNIEGDLIQQKSNNSINLQLNDAITHVYNFDGTKKKSVTKKNTDTEQRVIEANIYDKAGRLAETSHQVNSGPVVTLASYSYNELGQLTDRNLHKLANNSFLQSVDYRYNIRGWLSRINNPTLSTDDYNEESNDVFGMELLYEGQGEIGNTGRYDGLISGMKWKTKMANHSFNELERAYTYTYDKLGQLNDAVFKARQGAAWNYMTDAFSEKEIKYDLNGNITSLRRFSWSISTQSSLEIDHLSYTYDVLNKDQLAQVSDSEGAAGGVGFKDLASESKEYEFNDDGNLIKDKNKGISYTYNEIGKVSRMSYISDPSKYIEFNYVSSGERIKKLVYQSGNLLKQQDYLDGFLYENSVLSAITNAEGRVRISAGNVKYEYFIRDHLNNVRVSFEEGANGQAEVRQEGSYYAFGMQHAPLSKPGNPNTALFNGGSEWLADFDNDPDLYNTFFRQYDPVLGRFNGIDPEAIKYSEFSAYQFVFNNPISFSDPSGADPRFDKLISEMLERYQDGGTGGPGKLGGTWTSDGRIHDFSNSNEAFDAGVRYNDMFSSWSYTSVGGIGSLWGNSQVQNSGGYTPTGIMLKEVNITAQKKSTSSANPRGIKKYFDAHNGDIGNYLAGIGYTTGAAGNWAGNIIKSRSLYGAPGATTIIRTPVANVHVPTRALRATGTAFKTLGTAAGIVGVGITGYQYFNGQITGTEAAVDLAFGAIGFMGPIGATISIMYFGGKFAYESISGKPLFDKPTQ